MNELFLMTLLVTGISILFIFGGVVMLAWVRVTQGKEAAKQFFKDEF